MVIGEADAILVAVALAQEHAVLRAIDILGKGLIAYLDLGSIAKFVVAEAVSKGSLAVSFALDLAEFAITINIL